MTEQRKRKAAPVSAHPAFPAIVALWFAALLGLGSLVLPIALFENLSEATGLASLVIAAQPPLGVTARILIALVASGLGVVVGVAIARQVMAANAAKPAVRRAAAKRPISAHDELGEGGLDADEDEAPRGPIPGRRRALSVTDDSARSEFLDHAPLPGQIEAEPIIAAEPLDLGAFDAEAVDELPETEATEEVAVSELAEQPRWEEPEAPFGTAALSGPPVTDFYAYREPAPVPVAEPAPRRVETPPPLKDRPLAQLGMAELVERFARALEHHRTEPAQAGAAPEPNPVLDVTFAFAGKAASQPISNPVDAAGTASPAVPAALRPLGLDDFAGDEDGDDIDLGLTLTPSLADRPFAAPVAETANLEADADEPEVEEVAEESYSSLLAMKGPAGLPREPVRIEDESDAGEEDGIVEPVVVFPGQSRFAAAPPPTAAVDAGFGRGMPGSRPFDAPAARANAAMNGFSPAPPSPSTNSADTERALREALEKLQKMSGAA